jgi:hypothetical protein
MLLSPIDDPKESPQSSSVTYSRFRAVLFQDLLDSNSNNRAHALDNIVQIVTEWARVVTDNGSIADLSSSHPNPTPPFSPAPVACSIQATLFPSTNNPSTTSSTGPNATTTTTTTTSSVFHGHSIIGTALAMEKLTISTQQQQHVSDDDNNDDASQTYQAQRTRQESTTMSASSPIASSPHTSNSACHSASSSTSAEAQGASLSQTILSSSPMASSSYHFQNDPDVHFNRALPDKLSPLEERVAEVDEAARLLRHHILTILRFSVCCPYKDVKICLVGLLNELEVNQLLCLSFVLIHVILLVDLVFVVLMSVLIC